MKKAFILALCAALPLMAQEAAEPGQENPAPNAAAHGKKQGPRGPQGQRARKGHMPPAAMRVGHKLLLEKYDKDGDGKLSEEERAAVQADAQKMHEAKKAEILAKFDKDGDGKLSDEERKAMREDWEKNHPGVSEKMKEKRNEQRREHREEMLKKFDKDSDGKLSEEERKAMREAMPKDRLHGPRGPKHPQGPRPGAGQQVPGAGILIEALVLEKYDKDGNGKLSEEEIAVVREDAKALRDQKRQNAPEEQE